MGVLSFGIALATYLWVRRSFCAIADRVPARPLGRALRKLLLVGILLPTLAGFFSVSFRSCSKDTYEKIVADRSYLVAKNQEQIASSLAYAVVALTLWGLILVVPLVILKRTRAESSG
jgi:hypothetical protein